MFSSNETVQTMRPNRVYCCKLNTAKVVKILPVQLEEATGLKTDLNP